MSNVDLDRLDALLKQPCGSIALRYWLNVNAERLAAELRTLRAERDRLRAERDAAQAEAAGLREALALTNNCGALDDPMWTAWKEANSDALARTSDQHRARIVAVGLRETANRMHPHIDRETLLAEAERLEKEAGNETKAV